MRKGIKVAGIGVLVILGVCLVGNTIEKVGLEPKSSVPIITWIDDDTQQGYFENAYDIANELNIKITFACVTNWLSESSTEELLKYQEEGFHITTHSASHDNNKIWGSNNNPEDNFNAKKAEDDLIASLDTLNNAGFKNYDYFVSPGGVVFSEVVDLSKKYCKALIGAGYGGYINAGKDLNPYKLERVFINKKEHDGLEYYKKLIDATIECDGWLIFGTHSGIEEQWDKDLIKGVLQYAIDSGVEILPLDQAFGKKTV